MKVHIRRDPSGHVRAWIDLSKRETEVMRGDECTERQCVRWQILARAGRLMRNHKTWPIGVREHVRYGRWVVANIFKENAVTARPYRGAA